MRSAWTLRALGEARELKLRMAHGLRAAEVALRTDPLLVDLAARRLALFRSLIGMEVSRVSPLVLRLCDIEGVALDDLAWRLRPDMPWEPWLCGPRPLLAVPKGMSLKQSLHPLWSDRAFQRQVFAHGGLVVREDGVGDRSFGVRVLDRTLEMGARLGGTWLRSHGRFGLLTTSGALPDTVATFLPGRMLEEVVDHPLLNAGRHRVVGVDESERGSVIRFACRPVQWRMPWVRTGTGVSGADATPGESAATWAGNHGQR